MTAPVLLSSRQREILEAMAEGAVLRWGWVSGPSFGAWRYLLDGRAVDGRSVEGLIRRRLVQWGAPHIARGWIPVELTDVGRRVVAARDGVGS